MLVLAISSPTQTKSIITVNADHPVAEVQPSMWGVFFEDINLSADGGIYPELVRNRKARPDAWEAEIIKTKLLDPQRPKGQSYSAVVDTNDRPAFRIMVPEYYAASCLVCHGSPKGEMDITGYPKEGGKLGDLGAVISIALYH